MTTRVSIRRFLVWAKEYLRENWGAPFVLGFMALLLAAAVCLVSGLELWVNEVAVYAYYALVVGVVLQLVCFWKFGEKREEEVIVSD
jgi:heme/copper-type cytochrome/quinol oxidase subunit 4